MQIRVYKKISLIASRIRSEVLSRYNPGDRIPSEVEISSLLGESQNRVHRAILMLVEEGMIYSSGGRRGMFFTPSISANANRNKTPVKLKFSLPKVIDGIQVRFWKRMAEMFHMIEPSVEIELVMNPGVAANIDADCYLLWLPLIECSHFREIDLSKIPAVKDMVKDITKTGCQYGKTYVVPLFHSPGVFWAHRNMIRKCGLRKEDFNDPLDCFRWGDILQSSKLCAHGFSFFGFIYHAANYGIDIRREGNEFRMDPRKVKKFFIECSKYLEHRYTFLNSSTHITSLFHRGQQGIKAAYLNSLSTVEKRFELLGQPLKKNCFSCQTIFLLAMGKNTQHEDVVYAFLRFLLMDHIQELFISPETNFSVINRVYQRQYKELKESAKSEYSTL